MTDGGKKVQITHRALLARINRVLAMTTGEVMKKVPPRSRSYDTLGPYYVAPTHGVIKDYGIDLEARGRAMGLLQPYEELAAE
jgi:hypothetical protein